VQVDSTAVAALTADTNFDWWKLKQAARVRLWPADSPWIERGDVHLSDQAAVVRVHDVVFQ
jgi:hypothetical protein